MKQLLGLVLAASLSAAGLTAGCGSPRPPRVVVGIGLTANSHPGVVLAADEINAAGGIGGVPIELTGLDWKDGLTPFSPPAILEMASRFAGTPHLLAVVGHSDSASTLSAAASYNRAGVPQIVTIATNPAITNIGSWTYRLCLSDAAQGPALATYSVREWGKRRVALFYVNDDYGRGLARMFEAQARRLGAEVVSSVMHRNVLHQDDRETIRAAARELRAASPDLVVLFQRVDSALWTLQTLREAGVTADVLGGDNLAQHGFAKAPTGLTNGVRVSQFLKLDESDGRVRRFAERIRQETRREPDYAAAYAYDALYLVRDAVLAGGYSREGVKRWMDSLIAQRRAVRGVTGSYLLGADHDARRPLYVSVVENGTFRHLEALAVE